MQGKAHEQFNNVRQEAHPVAGANSLILSTVAMYASQQAHRTTTAAPASTLSSLMPLRVAPDLLLLPHLLAENPSLQRTLPAGDLREEG